MPGIREAQRENAMDLMRQVAIQMIARGGYMAMTLAQVGELAGYSRGLATHHFGSKAGLLDSILDTILERNAHEYRTATEGRRGCDRLAAVVDCALYRCVQSPDEARAYLMLALEPTARWAASRIREQTVQFRKAAEDAAREAVALGELSPESDAAEIASIAIAMARGYAYEWAADSHTDLAAARRHMAVYVASLRSAGPLEPPRKFGPTRH